MYFDANGNPKALSKGQYGIKRSGKVSLLLDRNGNVMLCVDNLLNGFPCMVVVFGCVVCLLMIVLPKSLFLLYADIAPWTDGECVFILIDAYCGYSSG